MDRFSAPTRQWFEQNFTSPTAIQSRGWPVIARGEHVLLIAPTGSGKTLAAFLYALNQLGLAPNAVPGQVRVVYVSPLKALAHDIERNLRAPLVGIALAAERSGHCCWPITVGIRTGDTPAAERERQRRSPPDILVTTPESLYLLLGSRFRDNLRHVQTVIIDEVHALAPVKRGTHLA